MRSPPRSQIDSLVSGLVPPLGSSKIDGTPYLRRHDIEDEIVQALGRPHSEWAAMAETKDDERLSNEALVFLVRQMRNGDRDLFGRLVYELTSRTLRIAARYAKGFDRDTTNEILWQVEKEVVDLVLIESASRKSDFLEIAFGMAVERRTINIVDRRNHSPLPLTASFVDGFEEESEPERATELVVDERDGPEDVVAQLEDEARRPILIRKAQAAVKDQRHLEAVILHHVRGWPITDKNPTKPTLVRHFKVSERQIRNWIKDALKVMRTTIGEQK
jgi:hypothetical protein